MSDTNNLASVWTVQNRLQNEKEWNDCYSFTSILIEECNGGRLDVGTDDTFDLGYVRAQAYLNHQQKMWGKSQDFQIVLKKGRFDDVGKQFTFKGVSQKVE